jgi:hypothetical protein
MGMIEQRIQRLQALEREIDQGRDGIRKQRRVARQAGSGDQGDRQASELLALQEDRLFQAVIHAESLRARLTRAAQQNPAEMDKQVAAMESLETAA